VKLGLAMRRVARLGVLGRLRNGWRLRQWERSGRAGPPPHFVKLGVLRSYARRFDLQVLVETGTYLGDTVAALRDDFRSIITIELDAGLAQAAARRFQGDGRIKVLEGDSGILLPRVLERLQSPALFWLDAHYSGGVTAGSEANPILRELRCVMTSDLRGHVILIDDARLFDGTDGYPTLSHVRRLVSEYEAWEMSVAEDIIRIHAQSAITH
jgi:hypothetical protein